MPIKQLKLATSRILTSYTGVKCRIILRWTYMVKVIGVELPDDCTITG